MNIQWYRQAETDLESIFSYVSRDSISIADKEVKRVTSAVMKLKAHPAMGRPGRVANTRELVVKPYIVAYRIKSNIIQILRVLHEAQAWPKLL